MLINQLHVDNKLNGKQRIIIKKNDKIIADYWVEATLSEEGGVIKLDWEEHITFHCGETLTLGEFKPYEGN